MDPAKRRKKVEDHLEAIRRLQEEETLPGPAWPPSGFYLMWHVVVGATLGVLGACVSLGMNVLGAPLFGQRPFELIRAYLTFPMGERALVVDESVVLTAGVFLYLATGALLGIVFHLVLGVQFRDLKPMRRFLIASALGLGLWIFNFYLVLSWLQPMLLGGRWILDLIPWWVGALTHLAFAWTVAIGEIWGRPDPNRGRGRGHALGMQSNGT